MNEIKRTKKFWIFKILDIIVQIVDIFISWPRLVPKILEIVTCEKDTRQIIFSR